MADIPIISITREDTIEDDKEPDEYNINDAHTDIEDLDSDDNIHRSKSPVRQLKLRRKNCKRISNAATDIEDYNDSDSEDEKVDDNKYDPVISLNEFLDHGYVEEANVSSKTNRRDGSQYIQNKMKLLGIQDDDVDGITDCENVETSGDELNVTDSTPAKYENFLIDSEEGNTISIQDALSKNQEQLEITDAVVTSDSDLEQPSERKFRYRKSVKNRNVFVYDVSDVENIMFTDDEDCSSGVIKHSPSVFDAEEIVLQSSDNEDNIQDSRVVQFPQFDITFAGDNTGTGLRHRKYKSSNSKTGSSKCALTVCSNDDEGLTDTENLNSSDEDDDDDVDNGGRSKLLIPTAFVKSDELPLTDVEDFDSGGEESLQEDAHVKDIKMPSPIREITLSKENATGSRMSKVMPMNGNLFLGIDESYIDRGMTDTEDMSGEEDYCDSSKYVIETLPTIDGGITRNSEYLLPLKNKKIETHFEPITDTEDLNVRGGGVRRRKTKSRNSSKKSRNYLEPKEAVNIPTTDVEDLDLGDELCSKKSVTSTFIPLIVPANDDGITDVESLSGDEGSDETEINTNEIDPTLLAQESFFSTVTSRDVSNANNMKFQTFEIPQIRKMSPIPDKSYLVCTDTEEMQMISDTDDQYFDSHSRIESVTPVELQNILDENGRSTVYHKNVNRFDMSTEMDHIKGHKEYQDAVTDVEYLDDDGASNAQKDACKDENEEAIKNAESGATQESSQLDSDSTKGYDNDIVRIEAINLVDSVLDESIKIVHSQHNPDTLRSESEHFAITCDVIGVDLIKSPTIESMSGKSFDDYMPDIDDVDVGVNVSNNSLCNVNDHVTDDVYDDVKRYERIERKFERLSSQLDTDFEKGYDQCQADFDKALMSNVHSDEVSNLQSDFSKISWDESASVTTGDMGLNTPDNDIQELPREPGLHTAPIDIIPKPSPRLTKPIPSEASATNDEPISYSRQVTENVANIIDDEPSADDNRLSGDYTDTKKFWQSLESNKSIDETTTIQSGMVPVPKPRSQITTNIVKNEESFESNSAREISHSSSKISSEQQVEYSDSSSLISDCKQELRDDDSMAVEERLEDESYPISDKVDSEFYDIKNRENLSASYQCSKDDSFEIDLMKDKDLIVDLSATKKDDFSIYKTKEREDILDLDDHEKPSKPLQRDLYKIDDFIEEVDSNEEKKTSFYIGESSGDIITKSSDQRSDFETEEFEFDGDVQKKIKTSTKDCEQTKDEYEIKTDFERSAKGSDRHSEIEKEVFEFGSDYEKKTSAIDRASELDNQEILKCSDYTKNSKAAKSTIELANEEFEFGQDYEKSLREKDFQSNLKKEELTIGQDSKSKTLEKVSQEVSSKVLQSEEKYVVEGKTDFPLDFDALKKDIIDFQEHSVSKEVFQESVLKKEEILESKSDKSSFEIDFSNTFDPMKTKTNVMHSPISSSHLQSESSESFKSKQDLTLQLKTNETEHYTKTLSDFEIAECSTEPLPKAQTASVFHSPIKPMKNAFEFIKPVMQGSVITTAKMSANEIESSIQSELNKINESFAEVRKVQYDKDEIVKAIVDQTFAEVQESLEAVQEDLIEVVNGGRQIKESPSEFEVKILPNIKYPQLEAHEEELHSSPEKSLLKTDTEEIQTETISKQNEAISPKQETDLSSNEDSANKLDVIHRTSKLNKTTNRWSVSDPDNYSSSGSHYESFEKTDSRPCSSDVENLLTYGNSSEYQTALDASLVPGSTEYQSAASWLDNSGKTISSRESMKSFDSESSGHLGSVENSENSETLVPSTMDIDLPSDSNYDMEMDESEMKLASLEACSGVLLEDYNEEPDHVISPSMKRSQEMTFQPYQTDEDFPEKSSRLEKKSSTETDDFKLGSMTSLEEGRFATSLEDGSVLSMSLSSASNVETIVENVKDEMASSFGSSLIGSYEIQSLIRDDVSSTSFEDPHLTDLVDNMVMTTSIVSDDDRTSVNTQVTTTMVTKTEFAEAVEQSTKRTKGHKRADSTSFLKGLDTSRSPPDTSLDDEMIIHDDTELLHTDEDDKKGGSGSDSDYDPYQSEYSRSFKQPEKQGKKKSMIEKKIDKVDIEKLERKISIPSIETIVEDVMAEVECEGTMERAVSQNMLDYSNIPDIMVTDDPTKDSLDDEELKESITDASNAKQVESPSSTTSREIHSPIRYAKESEIKITEEEYQELIDKQYKAKLADVTTRFDYDEDKADSPTSDSFEMLEQPDITDEFVIIEEVAKEAGEFDTEGKSVEIKPIKYIKKHDEEVETILVKSAPAATNEGSVLYQHQGHHDLGFDFEESPPTGVESTGASAYDSNDMNSSRKWVEMQLAEQAQNLRYPYEMERGVLEDIKEEDTDLEVGSSRISSFKDSFSSSTPEYDVLAGRKFFAKGEHDDMSVNSLQEFESLEQAISLENRKFQHGSQDSLSNGSFPKRYTSKNGVHGDDVSMASLKEFEGLENACIEAQLIEIKAKEEAASLLSRSDESSKSDKSKGSPKLTTITTKTTVVSQSQSIPTKVVEERVTTTTMAGFPTNQKSFESYMRSKLEEKDDDCSSNLMEVSSDSLEIGNKVKLSHSKDSTHYGSSDSLEQNKSGTDIMTSSLDSIEVSKEAGATAKSSRSDVDSLDQFLLSGRNEFSRRDSIDSIEMQLALMAQAGNYERDSIDGNTRIDVETTIATSGNQTIQTRTITTTSTATTYGEGMSKDISNDSLNINQSEPELLLTSTESLDQSSSVATNATYTNENNSQMTGSITSCGSNTLIDSLDGPFDFQSGMMTSSSQFGFDDRQFTGGTSSSSTTTTVVHVMQTKDGEKTFEYFDVKDDKGRVRKGDEQN